MKKEIPLPVVVAAIVLVLGGIFAVLMRITSEPGGAGDINKLAAEINSPLPPDFTPDVARGDAVMRGGKQSTKGKNSQ